MWVMFSLISSEACLEKKIQKKTQILAHLLVFMFKVPIIFNILQIISLYYIFFLASFFHLV